MYRYESGQRISQPGALGLSGGSGGGNAHPRAHRRVLDTRHVPQDHHHHHHRVAKPRIPGPPPPPSGPVLPLGPHGQAHGGVTWGPGKPPSPRGLHPPAPPPRCTVPIMCASLARAPARNKILLSPAYLPAFRHPLDPVLRLGPRGQAQGGVAVRVLECSLRVVRQQQTHHLRGRAVAAAVEMS